MGVGLAAASGVELARAYVTVRADSSEVPGDLEQVKSVFENTLQSLSALSASVLGPFASFGYNILRQGVMAAGSLEQTTIAFEVMLGSASETQKVLQNLTSFAAKTPFEMPEILQAARGLIQFGERGDKMMETLRALGDAASGTSTPFGYLAAVFNQVRGVGHLITQDFRQMSTRGIISLQDLAKHFKKTVPEVNQMLSSGQVSFEDLRDVLLELSGPGGRFFNMMERQSRSLFGLWSTLKDAWNIAVRVLAGSLVPVLKSVVGMMIPLVELGQSWIERSGGIASGAMTGATAFSMLAAALFSARVAAQLFGITIQKALITTGVLIPIVLLGAALGALFGWLQQSGPLVESFTQAIESIKYALSTAGSAVALFANDMFFLISKALGIEWKEAGDSFVGVLKYMIEGFANFAVNASEWMMAIAKNWRAISDVWPQALQAGLSLATDLFTNFAAFLSQLMISIGANIVHTFIKAVIGMTKALWSFFTGIPEMAEKLLSGDAWGAQAVYDGAKKMMNSIIKGFEGEMPDPMKLFDVSPRTVGLMKDMGSAWDKIVEDKKEMEKIRLNPEKGIEPITESKPDLPVEAKALLEHGRYKFDDLGSKLQDLMLKDGGESAEDKQVGLMEKALTKQDELIKAVKENKSDSGLSKGE